MKTEEQIDEIFEAMICTVPIPKRQKDIQAKEIARQAFRKIINNLLKEHAIDFLISQTAYPRHHAETLYTEFLNNK